MRIISKFLIAVSVVTLSAGCMPNSGIPVMPINNPGLPDPLDPLNPITPGDPNGNNPKPPATEPGEPHPPPPDPNQPTTEDDFWKLMQRFGFMQTRTKAELQADIIAGVGTKITAWSPGTVKDVNKNILAKYTDSNTKKYMNPYPATVEEYTKNSFALAQMPVSEVDYYLDVEYGAKDGKGRINLQRIQPSTLEVLYFNKSGQITNYTQTRLNTNGSPPALLRLTHAMFIPPSVYNR